MYFTHVLPSEDELKQKLARNLLTGKLRRIFGYVKEIEREPQWRYPIATLPLQRFDIPDFLVFNRKTMFIVEVKTKAIGGYALQQIERYLSSPVAVLRSNGRQIQGVVIGHHLSKYVDRATLQFAEQSGPLRLLTYLISEDGDVLLSDAPRP